MKGFIVDATYRIIHGKPYVTLFGRSEDGEAFLTLNYFKPYFFIREKDLKKAEGLEEFETEKCSLKNFDDEKVVKILVEIPSDVFKLRKVFGAEGIKTFEADIQFARRFLIDKKIQAGVEVIGDYEYQENIKVFKEPELKMADKILDIPLKVLSLDIETDTNSNNIYCISLVTKGYKNVLIVSDKKLKQAESFNTEKEMLERFFVILKDVDPDIITGWNVIDFDLNVIKKGCTKLEVPFILGRVNSQSKIVIKEGFFETSKVVAEGRQVIDLLNWVRSAVKLGDYKLETVAQYYLGEGKVMAFTEKGAEIEHLFKKDKQKLVYYNLKDSELVEKVLNKSGLLDLYLHRSYLTGLMIEDVRGSIASLDSIYLKKLRTKGYVAPSVAYNNKEERVEGAYVMESKPGLYDNIIVLDFKSLYPSLMRTFNLDPLSFGKKGLKAPNGATFSRKEGVMPEIIQELFEVREGYKKRKDEVGTYAIKIIMNSFYGVMASPMCRFYNLDLANAITSFARYFIKKTAEIVREEGYEVIYSDTDSIFLIAGKNPEKAGKELEESINKILKHYVKSEYLVDSYMHLEFKKVYSKFIMPKLRGVDKGAKKRYAGLVDGKLEIVGMEAVRGDWTLLAKKFQEELLKKVFAGQKVGDFVYNFVRDLRAGKYDDLLVYKKSIRKSLEDYTKITPSHIKAARKLKNFKGTMISYVYTTEGVEPVGMVKGKYDYEHYVEKQLKPIADSIFVFFNLNFNELLLGQKSLLGFK